MYTHVHKYSPELFIHSIGLDTMFHNQIVDSDRVLVTLENCFLVSTRFETRLVTGIHKFYRGFTHMPMLMLIWYLLPYDIFIRTVHT